MKNRLGTKSVFFLVSILCFGFLFSSACTPSVVPTALTDNGTGPWAGHAEKVEFVYFHASQQCATCLCFEKHITKIMQDNYSEQIKNGLIIYKVLNFQDPANADLLKKYKVTTSSLYFDRTLDDGTHKMLNVQDIWYWN